MNKYCVKDLCKVLKALCPFLFNLMLVLTWVTGQAKAQQALKRCSTVEVNRRFEQRHPGLATKQQLLFEQALKRAAQMKRVRAHNLPQPITIPLAFHIVYHDPSEIITRDQIDQQIAILNEAFSRQDPDFNTSTPPAFQNLAANVNLRFCIGKYLTTDKQFNTVTREAIKYVQTPFPGFTSTDPSQLMKFSSFGGSDAFLPAEYLNIWITKLTNGSLGFTMKPGVNPEYDGIVVDYRAFGPIPTSRYATDPAFRPEYAPYNQGKTLIHEMGHYFFLRHTWGDDHCGTDFIDDTPPAESIDGGTKTLADFPLKQGVCSNHPHGEMWPNYMNYYDDISQTMFTVGQRNLMRSTLGVGGSRETLANSQAATLQTVLAASCCPPVDTLMATGTGTNNLSFLWPHAIGNINGYQVRSRAVWDAEWSAPTTITTNQINLKGLEQNKTYFFQVRTDCGAGQYGPWRSISNTTTGFCNPPPVQAVQIQVGETSILATWPEHPSTDYIQITLRENDALAVPVPIMTGERIKTGTYLFNGLKSGTLYTLDLRWFCAGGGVAQFVEEVLTQGCVPPELPLTYQATQNSVLVQQRAAGLFQTQLEGNYRVAGTTAWSANIPGNTLEVNFTGLSPATDYEFRLRALCNDGFYSEYSHGQAATLATAGGAALPWANQVSVTLYPNPATEAQVVTIQQAQGQPISFKQLLVLNSRGEAIRQVAINNQSTLKVALGKLPAGLYLVVLRNSTQTLTRRLLIAP